MHYNNFKIRTAVLFLRVFFSILPILQVSYKVVPPPSDMRDAAAAAAVGTTPVETPGFDK